MMLHHHHDHNKFPAVFKRPAVPSEPDNDHKHGGWMRKAFHKGVQKALHHRRRASASYSMKSDDQHELVEMRKFSVTSISESQIPNVITHRARYDGSSSIGSSPAPSRSEAQLSTRPLTPARSLPTSASDTAFPLYRSIVTSTRAISFDVKTLLWLSNTIRTSISSSGLFGSASDSLLLFLERALAEEALPNPSIDFDTIKLAHLDKLVAEMNDCAKRGMMTANSARALGYAAQAAKLQRMWRARYRAQYFMIDETRTYDMITHGGLKDGNLEFVVGQWWLNMACAYRDGFVANERERPTIREQDEHSVLPLLTGKEELIGDGRTKYIREGKLGHVHVSLLSKTGKRIHVLRGFRLKSNYAPSAGVRYDGLWKVKSHSHKLDVNSEVYKLELVLERVLDRGVSAWAGVLAIPLPSQLDEWALYEKYETEKIRQATSEQQAFQWKMENEQERIDREQWRRVREFRNSVGSTHTVIHQIQNQGQGQTPTGKLLLAALDTPSSTAVVDKRFSSMAVTGSGTGMMGKDSISLIYG
ncbi:hypothetical protein B0H66DRAFT_601906 [Apodospora peruviana]|uniref:Uncharacterized protein n=1 Tax=Apodospora peruviana TaxID=516989 RepID=A0AAE0M7M1_9PEZI|nr:hypothetical protein B0H66DRAFT_601906 [Apodospora peruviana]